MLKMDKLRTNIYRCLDETCDFLHEWKWNLNWGRSVGEMFETLSHFVLKNKGGL